MQQHSYPSHSMHFVLPAPSPLTIVEIVDEAAEPGPLRFTSEAVDEVVHMLLRVAVSGGWMVS